MDPEVFQRFENIDQKIDNLGESLNKTMRYGLKGIRQYVDANGETMHLKLDHCTGDMKMIVEQNKIRNSRIEKLEKQTGLVRWLNRNPAITGFLMAALVLVIAAFASMIDVRKTIENNTGFKIKSNETTTVERSAQ